MYGLDDSSRNWYFTLKDTLLELGCVISKLDKCVFCYYEGTKLQGMLITHVDDLIYAGSTKFKQNIIQQIKKKFVISREASGSFKYLGWSINQFEDCIKVDQRIYAENVKPVQIDTKRKQQTEDYLNAEEIKQYQKLLGQLLWLSNQTRPDLTYDTLEHSTYSKRPLVKNLISLNKVVKKLPDGPKCLTFNKLNIKEGELKIVFHSDASLGNMPNRTDSGRGFIIFLVNGDGNGCVLSWSSNKIRRKVHSVFGAETLGFLDGQSAAIYTRSILSEILYRDINSKVIPIVGVTDSRQLSENIRSTKQCRDQRLRLDIAEIQEAVENEEIELKWTSTKSQLADALTKKTANCRPLCKAIEYGNLKDFVF